MNIDLLHMLKELYMLQMHICLYIDHSHNSNLVRSLYLNGMKVEKVREKVGARFQCIVHQQHRCSRMFLGFGCRPDKRRWSSAILPFCSRRRKMGSKLQWTHRRIGRTRGGNKIWCIPSPRCRWSPPRKRDRVRWWRRRIESSGNRWCRPGTRRWSWPTLRSCWVHRRRGSTERGRSPHTVWRRDHYKIWHIHVKSALGWVHTRWVEDRQEESRDQRVHYLQDTFHQRHRCSRKSQGFGCRPDKRRWSSAILPFCSRRRKMGSKLQWTHRRIGRTRGGNKIWCIPSPRCRWSPPRKRDRVRWWRRRIESSGNRWCRPGTRRWSWPTLRSCWVHRRRGSTERGRSPHTVWRRDHCMIWHIHVKSALGWVHIEWG